MISLQLIPESQANVHELRLPGLGRMVNANFVFNGDRVSILQDEKVLERDSGDGCIIT